MLTVMAFLILAQAYAEASPTRKPPKPICYNESDYPYLTGTGTKDDPFILNFRYWPEKCLRIVNSDRGTPHYAKITVPDGNDLPYLGLSAYPTTDEPCKGDPAHRCHKLTNNLSISVIDPSGSSQDCSPALVCIYPAEVKKGDYIIKLSSTDGALINVLVSNLPNFNESNFNSGVN